MKAPLAMSAALHVAVTACLLAFQPDPPALDPAMVVELVAAPPVAKDPPPPAPAPKAEHRPAAPRPPAAVSPAPAPIPPPAEPAPAAPALAPAAPAEEAAPYVPPLSNAAYLANPTPRYPSQAARRGWQGVVVLTVEVDEEGRPVSIRIDTTSGHAVLDESALATVAKWRFVPARRGSRPIAAAVKVPVRFNLADG